jgi:hypothetical protein
MSFIERVYRDFLALCKAYPWLVRFMDIAASFAYGVFVTVAIYQHWTLSQTISMLALLTFVMALGIFLGMIGGIK